MYICLHIMYLYIYVNSSIDLRVEQIIKSVLASKEPSILNFLPGLLFECQFFSPKKKPKLENQCLKL